MDGRAGPRPVWPERYANPAVLHGTRDQALSTADNGKLSALEVFGPL